MTFVGTFTRKTFGGVVAVIAVVVTVGLLSADFEWLALILALAVTMNIVVFGIAHATRRFGWLGLAVFLSVLLFGGIVVAARSIRHPELQPVALIRKGDNVGICGIYITETDKRVYLGRVQLNPDGSVLRDTGRIFWVPDNAVDMIKVGALQPLDSANANAARLLAELYADRGEDPGVAVQATKLTVVKTTNGDATTTVTEAPPHPRQQASPRPTPGTADECTSVSLSSSPGPIGSRPPTDNAPRDP